MVSDIWVEFENIPNAQFLFKLYVPAGQGPEFGVPFPIKEDCESSTIRLFE